MDNKRPSHNVRLAREALPPSGPLSPILAPSQNCVFRAASLQARTGLRFAIFCAQFAGAGRGIAVSARADVGIHAASAC